MVALAVAQVACTLVEHPQVEQVQQDKATTAAETVVLMVTMPQVVVVVVQAL